MDEKDYVTIIEKQKKIIAELTNRLDKLQIDINHLLDDYNKLNAKICYEGLSCKGDSQDFFVWTLGLSVRTQNCLLRAGVNTIKDFFELYPTRKDACNISTFGEKSLVEVIRVFEKNGFDMTQYKKSGRKKNKNK